MKVSWHSTKSPRQRNSPSAGQCKRGKKEPASWESTAVVWRSFKHPNLPNHWMRWAIWWAEECNKWIIDVITLSSKQMHPLDFHCSLTTLVIYIVHYTLLHLVFLLTIFFVFLLSEPGVPSRSPLLSCCCKFEFLWEMNRVSVHQTMTTFCICQRCAQVVWQHHWGHRQIAKSTHTSVPMDNLELKTEICTWRKSGIEHENLHRQNPPSVCRFVTMSCTRKQTCSDYPLHEHFSSNTTHFTPQPIACNQLRNKCLSTKAMLAVSILLWKTLICKNVLPLKDHWHHSAKQCRFYIEKHFFSVSGKILNKWAVSNCLPFHQASEPCQP